MADDQDEELQNQGAGMDDGDDGTNGMQQPTGGMTGDNDADEKDEGTDLDDQDEERGERV